MFKLQKFSLKLLLSFCLIFDNFSTGVAYKVFVKALNLFEG